VSPAVFHLKTAVLSEVFARGVTVKLARGWAAVATPTSSRTTLAATATRRRRLRRTTAGP
jgi:hypothetical protein